MLLQYALAGRRSSLNMIQWHTAVQTDSPQTSTNKATQSHRQHQSVLAAFAVSGIESTGFDSRTSPITVKEQQLLSQLKES